MKIFSYRSLFAEFLSVLLVDLDEEFLDLSFVSFELDGFWSLASDSFSSEESIEIFEK